MSTRPSSSYYIGRERRKSEVEMRPLMTPGLNSTTQQRTLSPTSASLLPFIERLKLNRAWNDRLKLGRKEKKRGRSRFAVNIPSRLVFYLIVIFFLIPLVLGFLLLIRALFFGLKEDDQHPLHKKIPTSHIRHHNNDARDAGSEMLDTMNGDVNTYNVHGVLDPTNQTASSIDILDSKSSIYNITNNTTDGLISEQDSSSSLHSSAKNNNSISELNTP